ncbi:MAG: hypothetical protein FWF02_15015 [Micrococcales bacterium]|nr:hypothetical protein [Micrococcales bacterium]
MTRAEPFALDMTGLRAAPSQTWGAVRTVPLLRDEPVRDLRLHPRLYGDESVSIVQVGRNQRANRKPAVCPRCGVAHNQPLGEAYISYVPHALVARWTPDGAPVAAAGTQMLAADQTPAEGFEVRVRRRLARRERTEANQVRFLPLHLAVDGYLSLEFAGPPTRWSQWSRTAFRDGLSPRMEEFTRGDDWGLDDALRVFEIHPDQCGLVLYTGDELVAAFVVPHPDDYRALHPTLVQNMYGEQVQHFAMMYPHVPDLVDELDPTHVHDLATLRAELDKAGSSWREMHTLMAEGLFDADFHAEQVYRMGRFCLTRFRPVFDPATQNHIGEAITDEHGHLAYLATVSLSVAQTKRGYLLSVLASHDWNLEATAEALGTTVEDLVWRLDRAGFGHLLKPDIIDPVRARHRKSSR